MPKITIQKHGVHAIRLLFKYFPELNKEHTFEKKTHKKQYLYFLSLFIDVASRIQHGGLNHRSGEGFVIFDSLIKEHFGSNRRLIDVQQEFKPYLETNGKWSHLGGVAKKWIPSKDYMKRSELFMLELSKEKVKHLSNTKDLEYPWFVQRALHELATNGSSEVRDYMMLAKVAEDCINSESKSIEYKEGTSGRLHNAIQNLSKEFRSRAFTGCYDYDVQAASPSILLSVYKELTGLELPNLEQYIQNRSVVREKISFKTGIDEKQIKSMVNALFFGMRVPSVIQMAIDINRFYKNKDIRFSITKSLGSDGLQLLDTEEFQNLIQDAKQIKHAISEHKKKEVQKVLGKKVVKNCIQKELCMHRWNSGSVMAHEYFGYERRVLDAVIEFMQNKEIIIMHDGFISRSKIDELELQKFVQEKTGIRVFYECEIL